MSRRFAPAALLTVALAALTAASSALAAPPREVSQPTLEGGPYRQGSTLVAGNGLWANNPTSFTYRWLRCSASGTACAAITGATNQRYQLVQADVGRTVLVHVTARNADGARTANSKPSPVIGDNARPRLLVEPSISGSPAIGQQLVANPGSWSNIPDRYTYQWLSCDAAGGACAAIPGATGSVFGVRSADLGRTLRVEVRAINPFGSSRRTSNATRVVRETVSGGAGTPVAIASVSLPDRLVISGVTFAPSAIRSRQEAVTLSVRVTDTRGRLVQGALVLAEGIPFGRVDPSAEAVTGSTGVATITLRPTVRLPLVPNTALQIFLRARKPGENVLAGISTRRLVQIRILPS
jgi:hypothetical protein